MRIIFTMILLSFLMVSTGYSQTEKDGKNNTSGWTIEDYENFKLTKDNLEWAKSQVKSEKIKIQKALKTRRIDKNEYDYMMNKINQAEARIRDFENNLDQEGNSEKEDDEIVPNPIDAQLINKNAEYEKRKKEKEARENKQREAKRNKNLEKSYRILLDNMQKERKLVESKYEAGEISESDYNARLKRFDQTERRLNNRLEELLKKNAENSESNSGGEKSKKTGNN